MVSSNFRASSEGTLFVQTQPSVLFSRAVLFRFALRGLNRLRSVVSRRLTLHSSGKIPLRGILPLNSNVRPPQPLNCSSMPATFHRFANIDFRASHQPLLSGFGLPFVASSDFRASNCGVLSVRAQPFALFSCAVSHPFAVCVLKHLRSCVGHCLTLRSRGTRRKRRAPYL